MHTPDHYVLVLAMLDGDRDARKVLADLLEEQGKRGLAQWARDGRKDMRRALEFAVVVLSCRPAIGLAAEFLKQSAQTRLGLSGARLVTAAQDWASRGIEDSTAEEACRREAARWMEERRNPYVRIDHREQALAATGADCLVEAVQLAIQSAAFQSNGDFRRAAGRDLEVRQRVRQIVRQSASQGFPPLMAPDGSMRYLTSVEWQVERTKRLLQQLLTAQDDLWPK